jgi:hypothetical protein
MIHAEFIVATLLEDGAEQPDLPLNRPPEVDVDALVTGDLSQWWQQTTREDGKKVEDHEITKFGVENSSYFQGHGVAFTNYDEAFVGTGNNAYEALEDALEGAAQSGWDVSTIKNPFNPNAPDAVAAVAAEYAEEGDEPDEDAGDDMYYYVGLRLKELNPFEPGDLPAPQQESDDEALDKFGDELVSRVIGRKMEVGEEVSDGTFEMTTLCRRGLNKLKELRYDGWVDFCEINREAIDGLNYILDTPQEDDDEDEEILVAAHEALDTLWDTLVELLSDDYVPFGTYFGPNAGSGSCYGCWPASDYLRDAVEEGTEVIEVETVGNEFPEKIRPGEVHRWMTSPNGHQAMYTPAGDRLWLY